MKLQKPTNKKGKDFTIFLKPKAIIRMKGEEKGEKYKDNESKEKTCLPMPKGSVGSKRRLA